MKIVKLSELTDISSGQIMSRLIVNPDIERNPLERWRVVIPKVITSDGFINEKDMPVEELKAKPDKNRITTVGDIVIKLSTPFDSATITQATAGCVVPSFCAVIRNKGELDNDYLQAFLNSKLCKEQLKTKVAGAVMTILSVGKINDVDIPVPDIEEQISIGKRYREVQDKAIKFRRIIELETMRNDILFTNMVRK